MKNYYVKKVVRGYIEAEILVNPGSFSFLGDIDLESAEIIVDHSPHKGKSIAGKILIIEDSKGSSGGALVLQTLKTIGKAPAAIITVKAPDFNLTEGAILTAVPYASHLPQEFFNQNYTNQIAILDLDKGILSIKN